MGRKAKYALKDLLTVPEISPRDTSLAGTKAASGVQARARQKQLEAMIHGIRLWDDKEGSLGSAKGFGGLIVADPPADLPTKYKRILEAGQLIVVDGVQRYNALLEAKGEDFEVTADKVQANSMADLRRLAFDYNFQLRYHLPLTQEEIWAHYLRDELGGHYRGLTRKTIAKRYGGWIKDDYLNDWGQVAARVRSYLSLDEKPEADIKHELRTLVRNCLSATEKPQFDAMGYPDKLQLKNAIDIAEKGLPSPQDELDRRKQREASMQRWEDRRKAKAIDTLRDLGFNDPELVRSLAQAMENQTKNTGSGKAVTLDNAPEGFHEDDD